MTRPGIDLGRELGGRGLDPGDPERERDWLAARLQHDPKGVSWSQMPRLRHHERDVDLIGSAGVGKPPGDDLPLPEAAGYPVVFRCEQVDVVRCYQADFPDIAHGGDLRHPRERRARERGQSTADSAKPRTLRRSGLHPEAAELAFAHSRADGGTERSLIWVLADLSARRWSRPHALGGVG